MLKPKTKNKYRYAFTLVELLVVIAIIGVLVALLLPAVQAAREAARRSQCANNIRQIGLAVLNYVDTEGSFPASRWGGGGGRVFSAHGPILPFMEEQSVHDVIDFDQFWDSPPNEAARAAVIPIFLCPSDPQKRFPPGWAGTNYEPCEGSDTRMQNGVMFKSSKIRVAEIKDGMSHTACISERLLGDWSNAQITERSDLFLPGVVPASADEAMNICRNLDISNLSHQGYSNIGAPWLAGTSDHVTGYQHVAPPNDRLCHYPPGQSSRGASSDHPGGVYLLKCDGSVGFVTESIDVASWRAIGSRNGSEIVDN